MSIRFILNFIRLNHFTPVFLILTPSVWTIILYGYTTAIVKTIIYLAISTILLIAAGCIWNDWIDLDYDRQVESTKTRPMASGQIPSWAVVFSVPFFSLYLYVAHTLFIPETLTFFYTSLAMTLIYPFAKRFLSAPQFFLGLINTAPIIAYIQTTPSDASLLKALPLYALGALWISIFDTVYSWQDRAADKQLKLGNFGNVIGDYMPNFIELGWVGMWFLLSINLPMASYSYWIALVFFIIMGFLKKSRFIKGYYQGVNGDICHPFFICIVTGLVLYYLK